MPVIMKNTSQQLRETQKNIIGPRVRQARLRARLTQQELAERVTGLGLRVNRAGIAKIEIGLRHVCDYELLFLAKALNVSATWLMPVR